MLHALKQTQVHYGENAYRYETLSTREQGIPMYNGQYWTLCHHGQSSSHLHNIKIWHSLKYQGNRCRRPHTMVASDCSTALTINSSAYVPVCLDNIRLGVQQGQGHLIPTRLRLETSHALLVSLYTTEHIQHCYFWHWFWSKKKGINKGIFVEKNWLLLPELQFKTYRIHWNPNTMLCFRSKSWYSDVSETTQAALYGNVR